MLAWLLYVVITLDNGDTVVAPMYNYKEDRAACVASMVTLAKTNRNKDIRFQCEQFKGEEKAT